jgi:hypothetical protein
MKTTFYFLLTSLFLLPLRLSGHCYVAIPANAQFFFDVDTLISSFGNEPIWACGGATVSTFLGGNRDVFLESGGGSAFNVFVYGTHTVWLPDEASLTVTTGALTVYYETIGDFVNLGGNHTLIPCPSITYDYTNAPPGVCLALPVELLSLESQWIDGQVELRWETAVEINNEGFEVQRSPDLEDWQAIGWVEGQGTTEVVTEYAFVDRAPESSQQYYRLMQVDFDGKVEYSPILAVSRPLAPEEVLVLPNPADRAFFIRTEEYRDIQSVYLINELGQIVWYADGLSEPFVDISAFPEGFYVLSFSIDGRAYQKKVLIKR